MFFTLYLLKFLKQYLVSKSIYNNKYIRQKDERMLFHLQTQDITYYIPTYIRRY